MEDQTQKIVSLQEERIFLQKMSYQNSLEAMKKEDSHRKTTIALLIVALLSLLYALVVSLLYYR